MLCKAGAVPTALLRPRTVKGSGSILHANVKALTTILPNKCDQRPCHPFPRLSIVALSISGPRPGPKYLARAGILLPSLPSAPSHHDQGRPVLLLMQLHADAVA